MRDLTDEELAKKPDGLDFYIVVGDKVYFTNVFGIDVYCAETGEFVDDSAISDLWKSAKKINQKPFDISEYVHSDADVRQLDLDGDLLYTNLKGGRAIFETKRDIIAKAKALGVTGEDLK